MTQYEMLWQDAENRIAAGIEKNRKSAVTLRIEDAAGRALPGVNVSIEQVSSDFLFGANAFMLGGYATAELNARYEEAFVNLFNSATIPFYWRDLEPQPGELRFEEGSRPIARRPPPDRVVRFCEKHGLSSVGHPLVWDFIKWVAPDWLPEDPAQAAPLWEKRVAQIAQRYGGRIPRFDVVNEVCTSRERVAKGLSRRMPENYARLAFKWAEKYLPKDAFLMINETTACFGSDREAYASLIASLLEDGARVCGIGMQFHLFSNAENQEVLEGKRMPPAQLFDALDTFARFGRPIHISEITLTSLGDDVAGRETQATIARNFYRLWFSHAAVHAITWWNVPDGGAAPGEDKVTSGLLDRNLEPKLSYRALQQLIREEWRTRHQGKTTAAGECSFRGFHGRYQVRIGSGGTEHVGHCEVHPGQAGVITIKLPA